MTAYTEPPKVAATLSFYSEEHSNKLWNTPNASVEQRAAARRVLFLQPDAEFLAPIIFGDDQ